MYAKTVVDLHIKIIENGRARVAHADADLLVELGLQLVERSGDFLARTALLVHLRDALLDVDAGVDRAEDVVTSAEHAVKEPELFREQLKDALIGRVALVDEVDDDDIVLLSVSVATADALLDALRVPRQVIVDDQRAELQVDALGGGLGRHQDLGFVPKRLDDGGLGVYGAHSRRQAVFRVPREPRFVDAF